MTDLHRNSKPDSVFFGDATGAGVEVDISEQRTDLTIAGGVASESPSDRAAITYPRELAVVVGVSAGDDGVVLYHGDPGGSPDYTYRMALTFGGALQCSENGILRLSVAVPGLSATLRLVLLHWSSRQEGSTIKTEAMAWNLVTGECNIAFASHAITATTDPLWDLNVGGGGAGDDPFVGTITAFLMVRIGRRFHSTTEAREDWVSQTTPPDIEATRRRSALEFDRQDIDLANEGQLAGPSYLWSGATARDNDRRCTSPLVNLRVASTAEALTLRKVPAPANWHRPSPFTADQGDGFVIALPHVFLRPVSPTAYQYARVRIYVRQANELGGGTIEPITYRMLSASTHPTMGNNAELAAVTRGSDAVTSSEAHTGSDGAWLDLGELRLAVGLNGMTWLMLSWAIGDGDDEDDTIVHVLAITVDPYSKPIEDSLGIGI